MCPHCLNSIIGGCVHCREARLESQKLERDRQKRFTPRRRQELGLINGRIVSPLQLMTPYRQPMNRVKRQPITIKLPTWGTSVLPANFHL